MTRYMVVMLMLGWGVAGAAETPDFVAERLGKVEPARWEVVYDFVERLDDAKRVDDEGARAVSEPSGGVAKPSIFHHPKTSGIMTSALRFPGIPLPTLGAGEKLLLHFYVGISDNLDVKDVPGFDGCTLTLEVNGKPVFRRDVVEQRWDEWVVDLTQHAGEAADVAFLVHPRENSAADWALWGRPRILVEGREAKMKEGPKVSLLACDTLEAQSLPARVLEVDAGHVVAVFDPELDLPAMLRNTVKEAGVPPVDLPPALVVGEGADPGNHTVVRILNRYHIAKYQFLAYPPEVRGGVRVQAGVNARGETRIVACPLTDASVREIRVFSGRTGLLSVFDPGRDVRPPYAMAVGEFVPGKAGHEIAVATESMRDAGERVLLFLTLEGEEVDRLDISPLKGRLNIARAPAEASGLPSDRLAVTFDDKDHDAAKGLLADSPYIAAWSMRGDRPDKGEVYASAVGDAQGWLTVVSDSESQAIPMTYGEERTPIDLGTREKKFWYQWYRTDAEDFPEDGEHIKRSLYAHLRTDNRSKAWAGRGFESDDPEIWAGEYFREQTRREIADYDTALPKAWEPCFTHRMGFGGFNAWAEQTEEESGFPKYVMLTRNNHATTYGEFGITSFHASTYAFGLPALEKLYILPLRAYLRELVKPFRNNPEHFVGLEPNHEHEIAVGQESTRGDYNLWNIAGFYQYLRAFFGDDRDAIRAAMEAPLAGDYFDAPRDWERGDWDTYQDSNPFFREWIAYQRYIVNRRIAQTFREALLAGFPPEIIKSHQIPDTYAIGNLDAFSDIVSRYTPIDYAMNAGVGYGFTRYTVWYKNPLNCMQGAYTSGFDHVLIGEYQALTPSVEDAYGQLRYIFDHGGYSAHCMLWPKSHDKGYNDSMDAALRQLIAEDPPRPGTVGGVGQIVPVVQGARRYNIAQIGAGPERTGLLKSVNADGSWEGSVYVQPFHAHVNIEEIKGRLENQALVFGPVQGFDSGHQLEVTVDASARARFEVRRRGVQLGGLGGGLPLDGQGRMILRAQLPVEDITLHVWSEAPDSVRCYHHAEMSTKLPKGVLTGRRHRGGVTFDLLGVE